MTRQEPLRMPNRLLNQTALVHLWKPKAARKSWWRLAKGPKLCQLAAQSHASDARGGRALVH